MANTWPNMTGPIWRKACCKAFNPPYRTGSIGPPSRTGLVNRPWSSILDDGLSGRRSRCQILDFRDLQHRNGHGLLRAAFLGDFDLFLVNRVVVVQYDIATETARDSRCDCRRWWTWSSSVRDPHGRPCRWSRPMPDCRWGIPSSPQWDLPWLRSFPTRASVV